MVNEIRITSVLIKQKRRNDWFLDEYSVNPYKACSLICVHCYIRSNGYKENMQKLSMVVGPAGIRTS